MFSTAVLIVKVQQYPQEHIQVTQREESTLTFPFAKKKKKRDTSITTNTESDISPIAPTLWDILP